MSICSQKLFQACWITTDNEEQLESFMKAKYNLLARDKDDNLVFLQKHRFYFKWRQDYPDLTFHKTSNLCWTNRGFSHLFYICVMRLLYFGLIVLFSSCESEVAKKPKNKKTTEVKAEIPMPLFSDDMVFADEFVIAKKFSNGDNILRAQSKADWAHAAENGIPAWCYIDSINKQGILTTDIVLVMNGTYLLM